MTRLVHHEFLHDLPTGQESVALLLSFYCRLTTFKNVITGTTPQRRDFVYTRQFTRTKPHSELLEQCDLSDVKESDTEVMNIDMYCSPDDKFCNGKCQ